MSRKLLLPLVAAAMGALFPVLSRAQGFKPAYGEAGSSSASSGAVTGAASASPDDAPTTNPSASSTVVAVPLVVPAAPKPAGSSGAGAGGNAAPASSAAPNANPIAKAKAPPKDEDPRTIPEGIRDTIGSSYAVEDRPTSAMRVKSGLWPVEGSLRVGPETTTTYFPFYFDRRQVDDQGNVEERETFYTLYYRKRSREHSVDAAFPLFFRWRDDQTRTWVIPPVLWRDAPGGEWHRWLAPLFFASSQPDGGYFHAPLLLTFSHHNPKKAFSLIGGLGFYDRNGTDVDYGVVPFFFGGHDSARLTSWWLIPPLLTYHHEDREFDTHSWVFGPVYSYTTPTTSVFDVLPIFLHSHGEDYSSTTLLPLFHVAHDKDKDLLVTPLFIRASDKDGRTWVTPFYSQYRGRTTLDLAGPVIPLFAHYHDPDLYKESWLLGPIYSSHDPTGYTLLTPLFGQFREYGVSNTTWVFPTFEHETRVDGWSFDIHPLLYVGHDGDSWHDVLAPIWWDFSSPKKRTTIAFPLFWRFRDEEGVTQVALNTYYVERPSSRGPNYDFYFLPFVHVGEQPNGSSWDFLFGFVGYKRQGSYKQLKLFWLPIDLTPDPGVAPAPKPRRKQDETDQHGPAF